MEFNRMINTKTCENTANLHCLKVALDPRYDFCHWTAVVNAIVANQLDDLLHPSGA